MAVDTSRAIKKPAPKMTVAQKKKMAEDLGKLRYDKGALDNKKNSKKK